MRPVRRVARATRPRVHFTDAYYDSLGDGVAEAEHQTDADIVVVIRSCSGNYRDVDYLAGAAAAWVGLLVILFAPWTVHVYAVPVEVVLLFALGAWLCPHVGLRRLLTTRHRRRWQVRTAALAAFVQEGVMLTRARTGVLLYYSHLERHVAVLADIGVRAAVPPAEWNALLFRLQRIEQTHAPASALLEEIRALGELLARHLPASPDNPHELPNRPRIKR
jgi:uncharacterized membrane protein